MQTLLVIGCKMKFLTIIIIKMNIYSEDMKIYYLENNGKIMDISGMSY